MTDVQVVVAIMGTVIATAMAVGGVIVSGGRFVLRAEMTRHTQPLLDHSAALAAEMRALTTALDAQKVAAAKGDADLRDILRELRAIVDDHDRMLGDVHTRVSVTEKMLDITPHHPETRRRRPT